MPQGMPHITRSGDPSRCPALRVDIRNMDRIIEDSVRIFEQERLKTYLGRIRVDGKTFGKVKRAAGLDIKKPASQFVDSIGRLLKREG